MNKKILLTFLLFVSVSGVKADIIPETDILASPSYWGLARSGGALHVIPENVWINPSLIPANLNYSASAELSLLPAGIRVTQLTGRFSKRKNTVSIGLNNELYGEFDERDPEGVLTGDFTAGRIQYFAALSRRLSSKLSAGASARYVTDHIADSRDAYSVLSYGVTITLFQDKTHLAFVYTDYSLTEQNHYRFSVTHHLEYLPLKMNIDYRYQGRHELDNLTLGGYFQGSESLQFMTGLDFRRRGLQTDNLGTDYIAGIALGGKYSFKGVSINLSAFSYGGLGTVTSLGVSYINGR
jgi:hypothetical protein